MTKKKEAEKEPEIIITGEQIEKCMAICNKHGKFNDFFIESEDGLEIDEYDTFQNARTKLFTAKMTDEEKNAWNKFVRRKAELKSFILLSPIMSRELWAVIGDGTEYNVESSPDIIVRGLAIIKSKIGL
jgi:hypothetical protein